MNDQRDIVFLAALLHDIGKFYQRADEKLFEGDSRNPKNEIREVSLNLAGQICPPTEKGKFGYHHVIWTSQFFENEKIKKVLEKVPGIRQNLYENTSDDGLANLACFHHLPRTNLQKIIQWADWWSAGIDRTQPQTFEKESDENDPIPWGRERYKRIPLYSIFNHLNGQNKQYAFRLAPLAVTDQQTIFPREVNRVEDGVSQDQYRKLWDQFMEEFEQLPTDSLRGFSETLLFLLKKYAWCIPSNTSDMSDVSLYDHLKTTAAFAQCLYDYFNHHQQLNENNLSIPEKDYPVILMGGDLSGIQNFIYNISSKKAAVSLKGRSFYLQLLTDSIIQRIIAHSNIQATLAHVVYNAGGKFYLLLPNLPGVIEALNELKKEIDRELWNLHQDLISFQVAWVPFAYRGNVIEFHSHQTNHNNTSKTTYPGTSTGVNQLWLELHERLSACKNLRFLNVILDNEQFFEVQPVGGKMVTCAVTGIELTGETVYDLEKDERIKMSKLLASSEERTPVSDPVYEQIQLGNALKDADYLIVFKEPGEESSYLNNRAHAHIRVAGVDNYLFDKEELVQEEAEFRQISSADVTRVVRINHTQPFIIPLKGNKVSYNFRFYGGNEQACFRDNNDNPIRERFTRGNVSHQRKKAKTFEEITRLIPDDEDSETYLGILRMDVDRLGLLFQEGIPEHKRTFSALSSLSFMLDLFFSGYLNYIRNEFKDEEGNYKYRDWVNILYSGGDDVFAVGRWDKIIEFAEDIRKEFHRFTGNPTLTLSAGVTIVNNKFPIAKAADMADEAEKEAKNYPPYAAPDQKQKNAICFLGETVSWNAEFDEVKKLRDLFIDHIKNKGLSKAILHKLMLFNELRQRYDEAKKAGRLEDLDPSFNWNIAYYFKRYIDRYKNRNTRESEEVIHLIRDLQKRMFAGPAVGRQYQLIALAARWAELILRMEKLQE